MRARLRSYFKRQQSHMLCSILPPAKTFTPDLTPSSSEGSSSIEDWQSVDENLPETSYSSNNDHGDQTRSNNLWQKVKKRYQLVDFHALPEYLRENEFILGHYRADWPLKDTLLSIFRIHNETLNIWTHLIGFLLFLGLTMYTAWHMPNGDYTSFSKFATLPRFTNLNKLKTDIMACFPTLPPFISSLFRLKYSPAIEEHLIASFVPSNPQCIVWTMKNNLGKLMAPLMRKPTSRWPFFIFLGGAMLCLLTSSACHLLCCHSSHLSYFLWRCDYAGIAFMIATSFFPPVYYTFLCHPKWQSFYLTSISFIGVLTVIATLMPSLQQNKYRSFRTLLFCGMGILGVIPGIHKFQVSHNHEEVTFSTITYEVLMGIFYGLGALVYTTRIPERWRPGSFDIAGHSHQIFHVFVVCGAFTHYKTALLYIEWRDTYGCD